MTFAAPLLHRYAGPPAVPGYLLGEFLGRGSAAVTWAATHVESGERVALKVLDPHEDGVDVEREEQLGQRVSGAHLLAVRTHVDLDDGRVALVLRLADGGSLRDVVTMRGPLPLGEVVTALTPVASALAELHDAGVVHADVAPGNLLFTPDGRPMLADLSSAWVVDDGWPEHPRGTAGFTAPEVLTGRPPVPASDVWSLGALAWYARTGGLTPPAWVGDLHWTRGMPELRSDHADRDGFEHGTIADVTAAVGPELAPLLLRMLGDDPEARPPAAEVALSLYRAAAPEPVRLVGHHPDPAAAVTTRIRQEAAETRSRSQRREAERVERRRTRRQRRRTRVRRWLAPWADGAGTWRSRVSVIGLVSLVLAGGMLGLLWVSGGPPVMVGTSIEATVSASAPPQGGTHTDAGSSTTPPSPTSILTGGGTGSPPAPSTSAASRPVALSAEALADEPVRALQGLADQRAAALMTADAAMLADAEQAGSTAHDNDVRTVTRLREQGQRYAHLSFTVRSAQVLTADAARVVLRATVDRSAYQVTAGAGVAESVGPGPGTSLRYTVTHSERGWRLAEVGPP